MISGAVFAVTLSVAERRKGSLDALSLRRVAGWGAIGGMALPMLLLPFYYYGTVPGGFGQATVVILQNGLLGAGSAAASLSLARRATGVLPARPKAVTLKPPAT
jgi:hypothetical protein